MKIELSISDDRELRAAIKDEIKGVIVSIARAEIKGILADVLREGVLPKSAEDLDKLIRVEIGKAVKEQMNNTGWGSTPLIKDVAREEVRKMLKELLANGNILP